jgi:hypothetical protein
MTTWKEFNRFHCAEHFYAIHFCCYAEGEFELSPTQEMAWMETKGKDLGYSLIHSLMLEKMYKKGLLK